MQVNKDQQMDPKQPSSRKIRMVFILILRKSKARIRTSNSRAAVAKNLYSLNLRRIQQVPFLEIFVPRKRTAQASRSYWIIIRATLLKERS